MKLQFLHGDEPVALEAERDSDANWTVRLPDGATRRVSFIRTPEDVLWLRETSADNAVVRAWRVPFARVGDDLTFSYGGRAYRFQPHTERTRAARTPKTASGALTAPMSGIVADLLVKAGETVAAYQPLAVIEAMKVMSTLEAPFAGTVKAVHVRAQEPVAHGALVVEIVPMPEGESKPDKTPESAANKNSEDETRDDMASATRETPDHSQNGAGETPGGEAA